MGMKGWTFADINRLRGQKDVPAPKASKYHAVRCQASKPLFPELGDRVFASRLERDRACELVILQRAGHIRDLFFQQPFDFNGVKYVADFTYIENGQPIVEDAKGFSTPRFNMIKKLWQRLAPCPLRITQRRGKTGIETAYEILPERKT